MKKLFILGIFIVALVAVGVVAATHNATIYSRAPSTVVTLATSTITTSSPEATTSPTTSTPVIKSVIATSTPLPSQPQSASPSLPSYSLSVTPKTILEGDPVMITIIEKNSTTTVVSEIANIASASVTAPGPQAAGGSAVTAIGFAAYKSNPVSFYGSGINQKTGTANVSVILKDGTHLSGSFTITTRTSPSEDLPVPAQLGGNSTSSQENLVSDLDIDNATLAKVYSNPTTSYWTSAFAFPVKAPVTVTDPYGYDRDSGAETIVHKGTDFHAPPGTPVYAINDGVVRLTQLFTVYGNTVIVDHGLGIQSFYMHLSKISVAVGDKVTKGELVGYSGETGYAEGPHLHLTIRVTGQSIDPMKFYALFGVTP